MASCRVSANTASFARSYYLLDATWKTPYGVAKECATLLEGRHKPIFHPTSDFGDFVVVTNCSKVAMTEWDWEFRRFMDHTGRPGRYRITFAWEFLRDNPEQIITRSTQIYLDNNKVRCDLLSRLFCFPDENVPDDLLKKVSFMLPRKKSPRKLSEYSQEELDNFPCIWSKNDSYEY